MHCKRPTRRVLPQAKIAPARHPIRAQLPRRRSACEALSVPSCSMLRLPPESARKHERTVPALSEEKCCGSAASPALAIEHVLFPFVQHAECIAAFQLGKQHRDSSDHPLDLAAAGFDHEVEVPFSALANYRVAFLDVDALEAAQQLVDVGRRQPRELAVFEAAYAEHAGHEGPVGEQAPLVLPLLLFFRVAGGCGFVPSRHNIEKVVVNAHQLDVGDRLDAGENFAPPPQRISRPLGTRYQYSRRPIRIGNHELSTQEINRLPRDLAPEKRIRILASGLSVTETDELEEPCFGQRSDGFKSLQRLDAYSGGAHRAILAPQNSKT